MDNQHMRCREAIAQLWAYIDQELDAPTAEQVRQHLDRCSHCFPQYDFQRAFCEFVASQCSQQAPPELRRRIFMQLLEEEKNR
jgi:mycothiol system anti-sigma-R factor